MRFILNHFDSTVLSVFFYFAQQFSSRFKSLLAFLKYKMINLLRSMCILNANCEVLIYVPSLTQPKVSLVYLSILLVMAEFPTSSSVRSLHSLSKLFSLLIYLLNLLCVSAYSLNCPFLFIPLHPSRSYRCIALVDIAACFRSRVDKEGALCSGVDLFSALILIGVDYSWLTGST